MKLQSIKCGQIKSNWNYTLTVSSGTNYCNVFKIHAVA